MQELTNWPDYNVTAKYLRNIAKVDYLKNRLVMQAIVKPGRLTWQERDTKIELIKESAAEIEKALRESFQGLRVHAYESPNHSNPNDKCEIYRAILTVQDNGLRCAGINLDLCYNGKHRRIKGLSPKRADSTTFDMSGFLALDTTEKSPNYVKSTAEFLEKAWPFIDSFHYFAKQNDHFDNTYLLQVRNRTPIRGGSNLLKKLGLELSEKPFSFPIPVSGIV